MVFSQITTQPGEVISIAINTDYVDSPLTVYKQLTKNIQHSLLLESAEINSKDNLKSLMLIDAAVTFTCNGNQVSINALNDNGLSALTKLQQVFKEEYPEVKISLDNKSKMIVEFSPISECISEDNRLKQTNAFEALRIVVNKIKHNDEPFALFLGGVFAYDMIANFESLPDAADGENTCPDFVFYLAETMVVIDHQNKSTEIIGNVFTGENAYVNCFSVGKRIEQIKQSIKNVVMTKETFGFGLETDKTPVNVNITDEQFCDTVNSLKNNIVQGDIFQVVPSRCFSLSCDFPLDAYRHLKEDNPSPYMFYLNHPDFVLFGASPESALKFDVQDRHVEVYPIAGTRMRGFDSNGKVNLDLDARIELELRSDKKEVAEHLMLVDLARNDVARISETGTRCVKELLKVDRYSYVMHLVSRVVGTLRKDLDALHAYQACMNMGTLVGAPKIKAASLIREVEEKRRGSYGGAVGYINGKGDMDTCIVIRSAFVKNNTAYIQAGAGVVFDSEPQAEADETLNKAQAVIRAVQASQALQLICEKDV